MELDSVDRKLVSLLQDDMRQSYQELSKQLGLSPATVRRRLDNLFAEGIIAKGATVDHGKMGLALAAIIGLDVANDSIDAAISALTKHRAVRWVSTTTGRFDILFLARFNSNDELSKFLRADMAQIPGVRNSETFVCLDMALTRFLHHS